MCGALAVGTESRMLLNEQFADIDLSEQLLKSVCQRLILLCSLFKSYVAGSEKERSNYMSEIPTCLSDSRCHEQNQSSLLKILSFAKVTVCTYQNL